MAAPINNTAMKTLMLLFDFNVSNFYGYLCHEEVLDAFSMLLSGDDDRVTKRRRRERQCRAADNRNCARISFIFLNISGCVARMVTFDSHTLLDIRRL